MTYIQHRGMKALCRHQLDISMFSESCRCYLWQCDLTVSAWRATYNCRRSWLRIPMRLLGPTTQLDAMGSFSWWQEMASCGSVSCIIWYLHKCMYFRKLLLYWPLILAISSLVPLYPPSHYLVLPLQHPSPSIHNYLF